MLLDETPLIDKNKIIFYTYGYQDFRNYILAIPYYFPRKLTKKLNTINPFYKKIEGERYKKMGYMRSHNFLTGLKTAGKLGYDIIIDQRYGIPTVKLDKKNVLKIFVPFKKGNKLLALRERMAKFFKIPITDIGITRSFLIKQETSKSNIDLCVKGRKNFKKITKNFSDFLETNNFRKTSKERILRHVLLLPRKFSPLKSKIKNKFWPSFLYNKKNVDLHFIKAENEAEQSQILKERGINKINATIMESSESFFAPYRYLIKINYPKRYKHKKAYLVMYSRFLSGIFKDKETLSFIGKIRSTKIGKFNCLETTFENFLE